MLLVVLLLGVGVGFVLGFFSKPRYAVEMSRRSQVAGVAGLSVLTALAVGGGLGMRGWVLAEVCVLAPAMLLAPYAGGVVRERMDAWR